ncbi:MAG: transglycosylase SLT domain-containing protein [Pseudobdellovibrionaceae bacterium]
MKKILRVSLGFLSATGLMASVNGCDAWLSSRPAYGHLSEYKPLRLLVVSQPLTYQRIHELEKGFEFDLLQQFAVDMGYRLNVRIVKNEKTLLRELEKGKGDLGAARLNDFLVGASSLPRSPVYDEEKSSLVCHKDLTVELDSEGQLTSKNNWKLVLNSYRTEASWFRHFQKQTPTLKISLKKNSSTARLLKNLVEKKNECTLLDRLEARHALKLFPQLKVMKDLSPAYSYFFVMSEARTDLSQQFRIWLTKAAQDRVLSQTKNRFLGKNSVLSDSEIRRFAKDRERVLPLYSSLFKRHGQSFRLPWQLAAAVAYQESKWKPDAQSFTGVKGFMQLTQETAQHLGVEDRLDTNQSIWGGIKYLRMLLNRQPKGLPFKERLALALATYNIGPAHMWDAQKLAQRLGKDPYAWRDLQEVLPLLADQDYLPYLKYGPARGREPVDYVHRVFGYLDLITIQI